MASSIASRYVRTVSRRMPVGGSQKKQFLSSLKASVDQYSHEHPDVSPSLLEAEFGSPDDIAADFISQMSYREINDKFRAKTRIVVTVLVSALLIVAIWAVAVTIALNDEKNDTNGYGTEELTTFNPEETTQ